MMKDRSSPYYLSSSYLNTAKLVSTLFYGNAFSNWKRSMIIRLFVRNKLGFIVGSLSKPTRNVGLLKIWNRCSYLVISWFLASLHQTIARSILYFKTPREIWKILRRGLVVLLEQNYMDYNKSYMMWFKKKMKIYLSFTL